MKRKALSVLFIVFIMVLVNSIHISVYAETADLKGSPEITPDYIAITWCYNNLVLKEGGKLTCQGNTVVEAEYTAGVKIELQQLSGSWTTIKTWEDTSVEEVYLYKEWYVEKGSYRLKTTHTALDSSGDVIETVTKYSETVDY